MKQFVPLILSLLLSLMVVLPLAAQDGRGFDLIVDVEGVRRQQINPVPGAVRYEPSFDSGGGAGVGVNWWLTDRFSLEGKVAGLATKMRVRIVGSDTIGNGDLGYAQLYPVMLVAQWHPLEGVAIRPYIGAGVAHVILRAIDETRLTPDVEFEDPTGLLLNAGIRVPISNKWSFNADARYVPVETKGSVRFLGSSPVRADIDVRPLVVGFGLRYHY